MIRIELAGPPRGKGRGRTASTPKGPRVYSDPATVKYETALRYAATQAMAGTVPLDGPITLYMQVRFPVPESWSIRKRGKALLGLLMPTVKPDCDNTLKLIDSLNQICFLDDKQVVDARVVKIYSDRPGLTIEVSSYERS